MLIIIVQSTVHDTINSVKLEFSSENENKTETKTFDILKLSR